MKALGVVSWGQSSPLSAAADSSFANSSRSVAMEVPVPG